VTTGGTSVNCRAHVNAGRPRDPGPWRLQGDEQPRHRLEPCGAQIADRDHSGSIARSRGRRRDGGVRPATSGDEKPIHDNLRSVSGADFDSVYVDVQALSQLR
jgi:hypothetical protein